jgi:hypothetical protein
MKKPVNKSSTFKKIIYRITGFVLLLVFSITIQPQLLFAQTNSSVTKDSKAQANKAYKVTFIELGSVRCIPCKQM